MSFSLILTHPGGSHKDGFLACCALLAHDPSPIVRREPTTDDLADPLCSASCLTRHASLKELKP
jgi:hypothetical protein